MYIRKRTRRGHDYYAVVEGERVGDTVRQQQVHNIGRLDTMTANRRRELEDDLAALDPDLLPDFYELLVEHDYDFTAEDTQARYALDEITPTKAADYGPVAALHTVAETLDVPTVLEANFEPKGGGPPLGKLLLVQSIARCFDAFSCDGTARWYPTTALPGLLDLPADQLSGDNLRNSLDYVTTDGMERVHDALWERVQERYDTPDDPLFYDLTTSYFEGSACPLAEYGYSSDKRPDKRQLMFGVTVNPDMVPLQHDVYPGNKGQSKTVADAVTRMFELDLPGSIVLVLDKGCATPPVRTALRSGDITDAGAPITYVAALKNQGEVIQTLAAVDRAAFEAVPRPEGASPLAVTKVEPTPELAEDGCRWISTYNVEKADRDAEKRTENLEEAEEALEQLADRQYGQRPRSKQDLVRKAYRTLKKHSVQQLVIPEVNERGPPRLSWTVDEEAVAEAVRLDGKALFETTSSTDRLGPAAVVLAYRDRDTVEKFMESLKDLAHVRPMYVYTESNVKARVFLCVLSVLLLAVLQLELDEADLEMTGLRALEILRGVRRVEFSAEGDEAMVVKTTELSDEQAELAHVFELGT